MKVKWNLSQFVYCSIGVLVLLLQGCSSDGDIQQLAPSQTVQPSTSSHEEYRYLIGPGDILNIFVWQNEEVSALVVVRPDGMINAPLVEDIKVSEKTPTEVAREVEAVLAKYIREPVVTVTVNEFVGPYNEQVRIIGEASNPQSLAYTEDMTLLDVIIAVGGLTEFADGNKSIITRVVDGANQQYRVRMDDLLQDGDISANVNILPGDIIVIPESWF